MHHGNFNIELTKAKNKVWAEQRFSSQFSDRLSPLRGLDCKVRGGEVGYFVSTGDHHECSKG